MTTSDQYPNANTLLLSNLPRATNNVMSYNTDSTTLWQWQKKIINLK
jgi:hypothetical protein